MNNVSKIIACLLGLSFIQDGAAQNVSTQKIKSWCGDSVLISSFGRSTIIRKDGSALLNCLIYEFKPNHVVYVKNKTMHDMQISLIRRIELAEQHKAIFFDNTTPSIQYYESRP